ncbi:hypothetical protein WM40_17360 [Robbsia andropogonis]|uniref:Uncharacterized protein n=1 Tax=Robbsia andropogonis TaxID=28092 RepID=A0A0F5JYN0_9BURK|nr:hypothetical protein [Robbsia andropogonis]KKB62407.1 hypothetical protein WM40_17360 [Robbsia andropogonis]
MSDALWGTLAGGAIGIASSFGLEWFKGRRKSKSLALSFQGSMGAIQDIVSARDYANALISHVAAIDAGQPAQIFKLSASKDYVEIYRANVGKLGSLHGNLPFLVPRYYIVVNSLLEDVQALHRGDWNDQNAAAIRNLYVGMIALLTELGSIYERVEGEIDRHYRAPAIWRDWIASFRYK